MKKIAIIICLISFSILTACSGNLENSDVQPGSPSSCDAIQAVDVSSPDNTVGSGTSGSCTEAALQTALDAGGTVVFSCGSSPVTITLTSPLIVPQDTVLDGGSLVTLNGNNAVRVLYKKRFVNFTLQNITLSNGIAPTVIDASLDTDTRYSGAGLFADLGGSLTVINSTFSNNTAVDQRKDYGGGGIYVFLVPEAKISGCTFNGNNGSNGGAIGSLGSDLTIINSTFTGNGATGLNAQSDPGGGIGGAIYIDGVHQRGKNKQLYICGSTFDGNTSTIQGGALFTHFYEGTGSSGEINRSTFKNNVINNASDKGLGGAVYHQNGILNMYNTTINNNTAEFMGGGLWLYTLEKASIVNSTFYANTASRVDPSDGYGGGKGGAIWISRGNLYIFNTTIAENTAREYAGGIFASESNCSVQLKNTIFYRNTGYNEYLGFNCNREMSDNGGNLQYPQQKPGYTRDDLACAGSAVIADPLLGSLTDNGGSTETMAPASGSPAIDAGSSDFCPDTDQREYSRDSKPDIGSVEKQ
ncbi:MAG: hypothetical protein GY754_17450 [bacterium]|nr:hypothetical protein [bacterium]